MRGLCLKFDYFLSVNLEKPEFCLNFMSEFFIVFITDHFFLQNIRDTEKMLKNEIVYFEEIYKFYIDHFEIGVIYCVS